MKLAPITVAIHTLGRDSRQELIEDVRAGLTCTPKTMPPRWFYDERGSQLFEEITRLPEYYQARTEMGILQRRARPRRAGGSIPLGGSMGCAGTAHPRCRNSAQRQPDHPSALVSGADADPAVIPREIFWLSDSSLLSSTRGPAELAYSPT